MMSNFIEKLIVKYAIGKSIRIEIEKEVGELKDILKEQAEYIKKIDGIQKFLNSQDFAPLEYIRKFNNLQHRVDGFSQSFIDLNQRTSEKFSRISETFLDIDDRLKQLGMFALSGKENVKKG
jgi:hypothetical protein